MAGKIHLSDAEWCVMNAVWEHDPASARDVLEATEAARAWAYTTVKTLLARLVEKGALDVRLRANTSLYSARVTQSQARRSALHSLVERAFDGTIGSLVQHMLAEERLSKRELRKLRELLGEESEGER